LTVDAGGSHSVVRRAVLAEQVLEYVRRDVLTALDLVQQILADDLAREDICDFSIQLGHAASAWRRGRLKMKWP
jgi:hypothetical protein